MFYISLPYFYENQKFNNFFKEYVNRQNSSKESTLVTKFNIEYAHGAFPWSYWNGGINNHQGVAILSKEMQSTIDQSAIPIRIDASSVYIKNSDYFDIHENAILQVANGTNTIYEVSDMNLMSYIADRNLNNRFIISNNAQLIHEFSPDIINIFQEQNEIELVNIGYNISQLNLTEINKKNKLEVSIGYCQQCSPQKCLECTNEEQKNIYNFSQQSFFLDCPYEHKVTNYYHEIQPYLNQGIQHFKLITNPKNLKDFNIKIIKSFVKTEYQGDCIDEYYRKISR